MTLPSLVKSSEDKDDAGNITFKDMLKKTTPGASKVEIDKMLNWIKQEEDIIERGVINYKMPKYLNSRPKGNKNITFKQIKDYLHIFESLDRDKDGLLEFNDFSNNYSHILNDKDFERFAYSFLLI